MKEEDNIELRSEEFQEVLGHIPHWILRWGISLLCVIVAILITGSALIKYPEIISAKIILTGEVPPAEIISLTSGKIKEIYVSNNQDVSAGDYLAVIDNPAQTRDILFLKTYLEEIDPENNQLPKLPEEKLYLGSLQSSWESLYILLFEYSEYMRILYYPQKTTIAKKRIDQYKQQHQNLLRQKKIQEEQLLLIQKQFQRDSLLYKNGIISEEDFEKSRNEYLQGMMSEENMLSSLQSIEIQIAQLNESLLDVNYTNIEKINQLRSQIRSVSLQLKSELQSWEMSYVLLSPINGKVSFTSYWSQFQNVSSGETVFNVVPFDNNRIVGKAFLPMTRSGKVGTGQKVNIRIDNFPENEYGILRGEIEIISIVPNREDNELVYTLKIAIPQDLRTTYDRNLPYMPNMQGQADIITMDISLLERFILPLKQVIKEKTI